MIKFRNPWFVSFVLIRRHVRPFDTFFLLCQKYDNIIWKSKDPTNFT
jgi:hypothetical protein